MTGTVHACGLATLDLSQTVTALPTRNQKVRSLTATLTAGGPALNAGITAAALGADVHLTTVVGQGVIAEAITSELSRNNVGLTDVAPPGTTSPVSAILITQETGERAVVSANATATPSAEGFHTDLAGAMGLLVDGHYMDLCINAARQARALGVPVLFDGGSWKAGTEHLLAFVDIAVVSQDFLVDDRPTTLSDIAAFGPRLVAQTRGERPILFKLAGPPSAHQEILPPKPSRVVDSLGAGDVFHGALLASMARRRLTDSNFPESLAAAARVASISCEHPGARGWIGTGSVDPHSLLDLDPEAPKPRA